MRRSYLDAKCPTVRMPPSLSRVSRRSAHHPRDLTSPLTGANLWISQVRRFLGGMGAQSRLCEVRTKLLRT